MRHSLATLALFYLVVPAQAADYDKYLLDDTSLVKILNVRAVAASPLFAKYYQKSLDEHRAELKKLGIDPLKDVDHLVLVMGMSSHRETFREASQDSGITELASIGGSSPLVVVQGRFDAEPFHAWAKKQAKASVHESTGMKYYQLEGSLWLFHGFMALADKNTLVFAASRDEVEDVLAKAAGKKKTQLQHAAMKKLLDQRDPKLAVEFLACHAMVYSASVKEVENITVVTRRSLDDYGIESIHARFTVGEEFKVTGVVVCKQAASAEVLNQRVNAKLKHWIGLGGNNAAAIAIVNAARSIKTKLDDRTLELNGQGEGLLLDFVFSSFGYSTPLIAR